MNKLIFQIGMLSFFVTSVVFGLQGFSLFDTISRAFIIFIGVELIGTFLLTVLSWFSMEGKDKSKLSEANVNEPTIAAKKS
ncbi:MAG TPA: hypothetical protein VMU30_08670 [Bacteroidota bacterium]|nr:hypothetical protein [Bacteroidota bacterium]